MPQQVDLRSDPEERRSEPRYPFSCNITAYELTAYGLTQARGRSIQGTVKDISAGGLSLLTDRRIKLSTLIRCEIHISNVPVAIPVLSQVRWVRKNAKGQKHRIGSSFLSSDYLPLLCYGLTQLG